MTVTRPSTWLGLLLAVATAACTGSGTVSTTTAPFPVTSAPSPQPTFDMTNFTMEQVTNVASLSWSETLASDTTPHLVDGGDRWFIFTPLEGGLGGWSSQDGASWTDLGLVIPTAGHVGAIGVSDATILAVTDGVLGGELQIWSSGDGASWTQGAIPIEPPNGLGAFAAETVGGGGGLTLVSGHSQIDPSPLIEARLRETQWEDYDASRFGVDVESTDEGVTIDVLGPLGFSMLNTTADDLAIESPELDWIVEAQEDRAFEAWVSFGDGQWVEASFDGAASITSVVSLHDGSWLAGGLTELGLTALWESFDGLFWSQVPFGLRPSEVVAWGDGLAGPADESLDLLISQEGLTWEATSLGDQFPGGISWTVPALSAEPSTLAALVEGFDSQNRSGPGGEFPHLVRDGLIITAEPNRGVGGIRVFEDPSSGEQPTGEENPGLFWSAGVEAHRDRYRIEATDEILVLLDADGSDLVTLTFDELTDLEADLHRFESSFFTRFRALALTTDGHSWIISDLESLDDSQDVIGVGTTESHAFVILQDHVSEQGFAIWSAPLG